MKIVNYEMFSMNDHFSDFKLNVGWRIYAFSPPIYTNLDTKRKVKSKSRPHPVGSSVLFKYQDRYFLVSAAHVFKRFPLDTLGLFHSHSMYYLNGHLQLSNPKVEMDDKIDIAIVELEKDFVETIPCDFQFYDLRWFNVDHDDIDEMRYLIVGSPLTRYKLKLDIKKVHNYPFIFLTHPLHNEGYFKKLKVETATHLLLNYNRKKIQDSSGEYQWGPKLEGISGCGIWIVSKFASMQSFSDVSIYPTAILIEYEAEYHSIVGTRMRVITEMLRQSFGVEIQRSRRLNVNLNRTALYLNQLPLKNKKYEF